MDSPDIQTLINQSRLGGRGISPQQNPVVAPPTASAKPVVSPRPAETNPSVTGMNFEQLYNDRQKELAAIAEQAKNSQSQLKSAHEEKIGQTKEALRDYSKASLTPHPPAPAQAPEPPIPNLEPRQYLSGEGKNALRQAVHGIGTLVTAFYGMSSPLAALNSLTGAMDGWHQGDMERAQRDFQKYQMELEKVRRQNEKAMQEWQIARVERTDDLEMQKALLQARLSAADLPVMAAQVSEHGVDRSLKMWETADQSVKKLQDHENKIIHQQLEFARQKQLEHSRYLTDQLNMMKINAGHSGLSDEAVNGAAERLMEGDTSALYNISRGVQGPEDIRRIYNKAYKLAESKGVPASQISANVAKFQGLKRAETELVKREVGVDIPLEEANKLIPLMKEASDAVPRTSWPLVNQALRWGALNVPMDEKTSAAWQRFEVAVNSFIPVYVRALKGTGVPDVTSAEHARSLIYTSMNKSQFDSAVKQLYREMEVAVKAPDTVRKNIMKDFPNKGNETKKNEPSSDFQSMQKQSQEEASKELNKSRKSQPSLKELLEKYK